MGISVLMIRSYLLFRSPKGQVTVLVRFVSKLRNVSFFRILALATANLIEALMPLFFCAGRFSIFVLRLKRTDMLKGITWGQFSIFILVVAGVYYLYVVLAYYRAEALELLTRRGRKSKESSARVVIACRVRQIPN